MVDSVAQGSKDKIEKGVFSMNNDKGLQVFSFEKKDVRVVMKGDTPWWVAKDVCDVLELSNPTMALEGLDEDERAKFRLGRQGEANIINESGLYTLIMRSNKPEARRFRKWVTAEVLPTIRKHGIYTTEEMARRFIKDPRALEYTIRGLLEEKEKNAVLTAKIQEDAHKVSFYDAVADVNDFISIANAAKLLNYKNMGPQKLFAFLRKQCILMSSKDRHNVPYQQYIDKGFFRFSERHYTDWRGETYVHYRPFVSQKGLSFINQLLLKSGHLPPLKEGE